MNVVLEIHNDFLIDEKSYVEYNQNDNARFKEYFHAMGSWNQNGKKVEYCDIVSFFLTSDNELKDKEDLELLENLDILSNLIIELPSEYNFSHLIPPVEVYKEIIEEYCTEKELSKLSIFQTSYSAKARIQNELNYKLGSIIVSNPKSLFQRIKKLYRLYRTAYKHLREQKLYEEKIKTNPDLALPPLESYKDYQEALKEKECFTYKLGSAFIKGCKSWYKGGLVKFFFEAKRLEREFKKNKNK